MSAWIKPITLDEMEEGKSYFIARIGPMKDAWFYSMYLSGKEGWSCKPGIAIRFIGGATLREIVEKHSHIEGLTLVPVPADADKRWRARKFRPSYR